MAGIPISALLKLITTVLDKCLAPFLAYKVGKNKVEKKVLESDVKALEEANEILKEQRDNNITTVDDADRMWDSYNKNK